MITQEKNRLGSAVNPVQKGIRKHLRWLERQLAEVDGELDSRIRASPAWTAKSDFGTIVSYNKRDFEGASKFGIEVVTAREFLERIGELK